MNLVQEHAGELMKDVKIAKDVIHQKLVDLSSRKLKKQFQDNLKEVSLSAPLSDRGSVTLSFNAENRQCELHVFIINGATEYALSGVYYLSAQFLTLRLLDKSTFKVDNCSALAQCETERVLHEVAFRFVTCINSNLIFGSNLLHVHRLHLKHRE